MTYWKQNEQETQTAKLNNTKNDFTSKSPKKKFGNVKERREGRMKDALALGGEEGRDKLR